MATLTALQILAYCVASAFFLGFLLGLRTRGARLGRAALAIGVVLQLADIGVRCTHLHNPLSSTPDAIAFVGWMIAAGYLGASFRYRLPAAGAFAVPSALVLLVLARVAPAATGAPPPGALGRAHILLATVGAASFALAAMLAVLYLFEERQLKHRQFGRLLGRGTPLETLDRLAARCVSLGFPVFTVALITGAYWVARLGALTGARPLLPEHVLAIMTWVAFGILLVARTAAGWQGRRAAWLTLGGFGGTLMVLALYYLHHAA